MRSQKDSGEVLVDEEASDSFTALSERPISEVASAAVASASAVTALLHSFDLGNQPLISGVPGLPGEIVPARSSVLLLPEHVGSTLVVLFEQSDVRRPIIVGVLQAQRPPAELLTAPPRLVSVQADDGRIVLSAEREIVLRCGEASLTLTRAGKVLIRGAYVSNRSSGVNRIKGGSVQIN